MTGMPGASAISRKLVNVSMCFKALWGQIAHLELAFRVNGYATSFAGLSLLAESPDRGLEDIVGPRCLAKDRGKKNRPTLQ